MPVAKGMRECLFGGNLLRDDRQLRLGAADPANPVELAVSTVPKNWSGNSGGDFSRPRDLRRDDSVPRSDRATQEDQVHLSAVGRSPDPHAILTFDTGTDRWH